MEYNGIQSKSFAKKIVSLSKPIDGIMREKSPLFVFYHQSSFFFHFCVYPRFFEHVTQRSKMECFDLVAVKISDQTSDIKVEQSRAELIQVDRITHHFRFSAAAATTFFFVLRTLAKPNPGKPFTADADGRKPLTPIPMAPWCGISPSPFLSKVVEYGRKRFCRHLFCLNLSPRKGKVSSF